MEEPTNNDEIEQQSAMFALGALPAEEAEAFGKRLAAGCPYCNAEVDEFNLALSALPLSIPPAAPPPRLRARLFESIAETGERDSSTEQAILVRMHETPWKRSPFPGVEMRYLYKHDTMLVRMAANSRIPAHPHAKAEQCMVLEGSISSNGITANGGDFVRMPAGSAHHDIDSRDGALLLITYT